MENKIIDAFLVIIIIECSLALFLVTYVLIQIVVCNYKAWKRNKAEEDRYRKMEDKFKNRKLTD